VADVAGALTADRRRRLSAEAKAEQRRGRLRVLEWVAVHSVALGLGILFLLPFVFVLLTSVMSSEQALTTEYWPREWHWENYVSVVQTEGFLTWWRNSLMYAVLGTFLTLVSSTPIAYALAKMRFAGRNIALMLVISMMMLPPQVVIVPMYLLWAKQFHLTGTLWPIIIPLAFGDAYSIFLLRQFLLTIPREYVDAAKVDGCGEWRTLVLVIVPMIKPALMAVALFQFFYCWNDYFGPQIYASENPAAWTLSYGLQSFKSAHHVNWNLTMAATLLVMAPVIMIFLLAQRAFIRGVTLTGVKG
jgi:multiple sugar transport system permease protein